MVVSARQADSAGRAARRPPWLEYGPADSARLHPGCEPRVLLLEREQIDARQRSERGPCHRVPGTDTQGDQLVPHRIVIRERRGGLEAKHLRLDVRDLT